MRGSKYKVAFIGTHGVGKTTLCYHLAARLKARDVSLDIVGEVARRCPLPINRRSTLDAQTWILLNQISEEVLATARYEMVICDRSVLDNYVYLLNVAGRQDWLDSLVDSWIRSYDLLVHVPVLSELRADGLRSTDPSFQQHVDQQLCDEIERRDLRTLRLAGPDRDQWIEDVESEVLKHLRPTQLELL